MRMLREALSSTHLKRVEQLTVIGGGNSDDGGFGALPHFVGRGNAKHINVVHSQVPENDRLFLADGVHSQRSATQTDILLPAPIKLPQFKMK